MRQWWCAGSLYVLLLRTHGFSVPRQRPRSFKAREGGLQLRRGPGTSSAANAEDVSSSEWRWSTTVETAGLVTGAAVGGGFLALPRACNGVGLLPSSLALIAAWAYMTLSSVALAEGTLMTLAERRRRSTSDTPNESVAADEGASIFAVVAEALGPSWRTRFVLGIASTCFVLGTMASLSSQVAKVRSLAAAVLPPGAESAATIATGALAYALSFGISPRFAEKFSAFLAASMVLSFAALLRTLSVDFSISSVARHSNWAALVPWNAAARAGDPWPFMLFCNILCFGEVVAIACRKLDAESAGKHPPPSFVTPIFLGGALPLLMALALMVAASALPGVSVRDPLDAVLASGSPFETVAIVGFAVCAIATTIIGTLLAVSQFLSDLVCAKFGFCSIDQRRVVRILSILAPSIASYLHEDFFYRALAFAGGFPVIVLWGILPVFLLDNLRQRTTRRPSNHLLPGGPYLLTALKLLGVNLLALNTYVCLRPG